MSVANDESIFRSFTLLINPRTVEFIKIYKIENVSKTSNFYFKFNLSSSFKSKMNSNWK